jgi:hypothetical protein
MESRPVIITAYGLDGGLRSRLVSLGSVRVFARLAWGEDGTEHVHVFAADEEAGRGYRGGCTAASRSHIIGWDREAALWTDKRGLLMKELAHLAVFGAELGAAIFVRQFGPRLRAAASARIADVR